MSDNSSEDFQFGTPITLWKVLPLSPHSARATRSQAKIGEPKKNKEKLATTHPPLEQPHVGESGLVVSKCQRIVGAIWSTRNRNVEALVPVSYFGSLVVGC